MLISILTEAENFWNNNLIRIWIYVQCLQCSLKIICISCIQGAIKKYSDKNNLIESKLTMITKPCFATTRMRNGDFRTFVDCGVKFLGVTWKKPRMIEKEFYCGVTYIEDLFVETSDKQSTLTKLTSYSRT